MAENVLKLKKRAVELGMSKADAMKATREELESFIESAEASKKSGAKKSSKKKASTKASKKKAAEIEKADDDDEDDDDDDDEEEAEVEKPKRGRPKGSGKKKAGAKKSATKKPAKKAAEKKSTKKANSDDAGRAAIGKIDWSAESDEWNPRKGGPTEKMFRALKKAKGNVDKAFDALKSDLYDYVGKNKRDGTRRTKGEAEAMLRYRLNRTKFEFATRTGQHEIATNRVEYGKGGYASAKPKSKPKKDAPKKAGAKKSKSKSSGKKKAGRKPVKKK